MATGLPAGSAPLIGGKLCLDFTNTVGGRSEKGALLREKLLSYEDLLQWGHHACTISEGETRRLRKHGREDPVASGRMLRRAIQLRETIYRLFRSIVKKGKPGAVYLNYLNTEMKLLRSRELLAHGGSGFSLRWKDSEKPMDRMLWLIVASAVDLLTSVVEQGRLRECEGEKCGWLFLDTSRNHSRQWCRMTDCGNLAKVHRFRRRHAGGRSDTRHP